MIYHLLASLSFCVFYHLTSTISSYTISLYYHLLVERNPSWSVPYFSLGVETR